MCLQWTGDTFNRSASVFATILIFIVALLSLDGGFFECFKFFLTFNFPKSAVLLQNFSASVLTE